MTASIEVTPDLSIRSSEIRFDFIRSSGPGGQNVNKVATAVQLRFDAARSPSLSASTLERLRRIAGRRMTPDGVMIIHADRFRSQERNRQDALDRLMKMLKEASITPKKRFKTKPSANSVDRVRRAKRHRSGVKALRRPVSGSDD